MDVTADHILQLTDSHAYITTKILDGSYTQSNIASSYSIRYCNTYAINHKMVFMSFNQSVGYSQSRGTLQTTRHTANQVMVHIQHTTNQISVHTYATNQMTAIVHVHHHATNHTAPRVHKEFLVQLLDTIYQSNINKSIIDTNIIIYSRISVHLMTYYVFSSSSLRMRFVLSAYIFIIFTLTIE
jgi:hypothetical protein